MLITQRHTRLLLVLGIILLFTVPPPESRSQFFSRLFLAAVLILAFFTGAPSARAQNQQEMNQEARRNFEKADAELNRINVLEFSRRTSLDEEKVISGFLHASRLGLFDLSWNVLCPGCGGVLGEVSVL